MNRTIQRFLVLALVGLLLTATLSVAVAFDRNEKSWTDPNGSGVTITFSTPLTYANCSTEASSDAIWTSGVPDNWSLRGWVRVEYVTDSGRQLVQAYQVDTTGDLWLEIAYPPVSEWPVFIDPKSGNPLVEVHVDMSIRLYDEAGNPVNWVGGDQTNAPGVLGPRQDWDVFCLTPPPPSGDEGCTPGYWKQPQHMDSWPNAYAPGDLFDEVFGVDAPGNATLLEALGQKGGQEKALMRHATAGLLNAASSDVGYFYGKAEIIQLVQDAFASGDFNAAKDLLEAQNESFCPID